ncbi:MAG TPA: hypothetical protein PLO37_02175 [Candidatus Hydrogenedentes bacterium]|nr:hypothetical protein [Candidatus Hydrogenedentota bacterium]HPG65625.1 hypothetical protein [Candidatus Hydrogenedentota bacterium]
MKKLALIMCLAVGGFALAHSLSVPWFIDNAAKNTGLAPASGTCGIVALHNNMQVPMECWIEYFAPDGTPLDYKDTVGDVHTDWEDSGRFPTLESYLPARKFIWSPTFYTFVLKPNETVGFRPVSFDPEPSALGATANGETVTEADASTSFNGQEGFTGVVVPNRPRYGIENTYSGSGAAAFSEGPAGTQTIKLNGSIKISWSQGGASSIQGRYIEYGASCEAAYLLPEISDLGE